MERAILHDFARETWPHDSRLRLDHQSCNEPPRGTTSAPGLLRTLNANFLSSLGPASAGSQLLSRGISLSFDNNGAVIKIPNIVAGGDRRRFCCRRLRQFRCVSSSSALMTLEPRKFASDLGIHGRTI